jgi:hypothetical protein
VLLAPPDAARRYRFSLEMNKQPMLGVCQKKMESEAVITSFSLEADEQIALMRCQGRGRLECTTLEKARLVWKRMQNNNNYNNNRILSKACPT